MAFSWRNFAGLLTKQVFLPVWLGSFLFGAVSAGGAYVIALYVMREFRRVQGKDAPTEG